ncbi:hypothetical protein SDJN02_05866, partial [Cucurbita argyrosperma subsp. argyrosperma]
MAGKIQLKRVRVKVHYLGVEAYFYVQTIYDSDTLNSTESFSFIEKRELGSLWKPRPRSCYKYCFDLNCTTYLPILVAAASLCCSKLLSRFNHCPWQSSQLTPRSCWRGDICNMGKSINN